MLKVWGRRSSFNVQKVLWFAGELGIPYEHIPAGGAFGIRDTPEFLAMNPHGRVPVIDDEGTVVWESHSILRYLAARYGRPIFWDEDPGRRSNVDSWMDWSQTSLQPAFLTGVFWGFYRTPSELRDQSAVEKSVGLCAGYFKLLNDVLCDRPFLCGDTLSLADITAGTNLYRYFALEIDRPSVPNVQAWYDKLKHRAAYQEHVMVPFDELRGRLDY